MLLHIINTWRRRSKFAICAGFSIAWTSNRLRSEGRGGRPRLRKSSARNSWRKLAIFFARYLIWRCLPNRTSSLLTMVSCHLSAPQPILWLPPPRRLCVISRRRCARAQILQRMSRQLPLSCSPASGPMSAHHLSALKGTSSITPDTRDSCCQSSFSKPSSPSSIRAAKIV